MQNAIYDMLISGFAEHFGTSQPLESGNGARFKSARKGAISVYHANIASGNSAEVAFEPSSMSRRLGLSERELRSLVAEMRAFTARDVDPNPQYNWPRVGVSTVQHAQYVLSAIGSRLGVGR